jgi:predicted nucleic acid-binding Zn ribbon protein
MRRSATRSIGDFLVDFVRESGIETRLKEVDAVGFWNELMGPVMIRYTRNARVSKGVLYVELTSSVVKAELMMMREELRKRINEKAGREIIFQIIFR